nr:hypothetical protein [Methanolobus sp.]
MAGDYTCDKYKIIIEKTDLNNIEKYMKSGKYYNNKDGPQNYVIKIPGFYYQYWIKQIIQQNQSNVP